MNLPDTADPVRDAPTTGPGDTAGEGNRLVKEARRNVRRLEVSAVGQAMAAGSAVGSWITHGYSGAKLMAAIAAILAIPVTMALRRRQWQRADWLTTTERWWERLDEMPRMEPFPRVVDFVEERLMEPSRRLVRRGRR